MDFWEELRHVIAPIDDLGRTLEVWTPQKAHVFYEKLAADKGFVLTEDHWSWINRPESAAILRFEDDVLYSISTYWRRHPSIALSIMSIGHSMGDDRAHLRAMWDVGIREVRTHVDRESSHLQRLRDAGWQFEQRSDDGRWYGRYFMEDRP